METEAKTKIPAKEASVLSSVLDWIAHPEPNENPLGPSGLYLFCLGVFGAYQLADGGETPNYGFWVAILMIYFSILFICAGFLVAFHRATRKFLANLASAIRPSVDIRSEGHNENPTDSGLRIVLFICLAAIIASILYPPFHAFGGTNGREIDLGYGWIFHPPRRGSINQLQLLVQLVVIASIGTPLFLLAGNATENRALSGALSAGLWMQFWALRVVRGLFGLFAAYKFIGTMLWMRAFFEETSKAGIYGADAILLVDPNTWSVLTIQFIVMLIAGWCFFGLGSLLNTMHLRRFGTPHATLQHVWRL